MVNKNVLSCLLKDGKKVNAVMLVGRLFYARATVTRNDRSPMVLSRVRGTIRRGQEPDRSLSLKVDFITWMPGCCMLVDSEGDDVCTALYRAPSEPDSSRGAVGLLHDRGGWCAGADDRLAERRAHVAGKWGRPLPYRDGRLPVVAAHRRRQTRRQRLVSVHCRQCRRNGHQPSSPHRTRYSDFMIMMMMMMIIIIIIIIKF